jgi:hypothetical protein
MSYNRVFATAPGVFAAGLVGTLGYRLTAADGTDTVARTTAGIVEKSVVSVSTYLATVAVPDDFVGVILWDDAGAVMGVESVLPLLKIADGVLTTAAFADNALTNAKIASDAREGIRDSVWTKAMTELTSVPALTASIFDGIRWLFTRQRNKRQQTASAETLYRDDGTTPLATASTSDESGVATIGKFTTPA